MTTVICTIPALPSNSNATVRISKSPIDPLNFFSSVTLYGLADSSNGPSSIQLARDHSFPAKRYVYDLDSRGPSNGDQWNALPLPVGRLHADLEITEQLSEGRIGIVFAARLICLRQSPNADSMLAASIPIPLPAEFCIKLAKPEYIRSLAREAWFYEQLSKEEGYSGAITPFCFGFFTSPLPVDADLRVTAWSSARIKPEKPSYSPVPGQELIYDGYYDDNEWSQSFFDDNRTSHSNSPWALKQWHSRTDHSPIVGVLITERLGEPFPLELRDFREKRVNDLSENEISELLDDLSAAGIMHDDVKFNNFLRPASRPWLASQICPHHKREHPWRVIDFDRSFKWDTSNPTDHWRHSDVQKYSGKGSMFWGAFEW